jgi:ATP-dependent RNA helicase RhlE
MQRRAFSANRRGFSANRRRSQRPGFSSSPDSNSRPAPSGNRFSGGGRSQRGFNPSRRKIISLNPVIYVNSAQIEDVTPEYVSKNQFSDFNIDDRLKQNIKARKYVTPTPIQDEAIPPLLEGKDVVGMASTGTGKTAAFLIPLINKVLSNRSEKILIVAPTRELAVQIQEELNIFAGNLSIDSALCIGGVGFGSQINGLRRNPNFVIGTPGRLMDLAKQRKLDFYHFNNIVLDEVDRMLDMGFVEDVKRIVAKLPRNRQSLFFSATMNKKVEDVMKGFLNNPIMVTVPSIHNVNSIKQDIVRIAGRNKADVLTDLLREEGFEKVLVFGRTKHGIEKLARTLSERGVKVASIHGNKKQNQRQNALADFKDGYVQVLLATDVASRGIDVADVTHVINYDEPESYEDYIHRIGRTGRANKKGIALTFVD